MVEVYNDNDISAWSGKRRPGYQAMLQAVERDEVDVIVAWHPDRLHRQMRELVPFIDLVNEHRVTIETVTAGELDLSTPSGRMNARIVGSVAEYESEHKAERIKSKMAQLAAEGRNHGGSRPYGWTEDRIHLDPSEASVVRQMAAMLLEGEPVMAIARQLNAAGFTTATGKPWTGVGVRDALIRDRNAGIRTYRGERAGQGEWEPILDEPTFLQVKAILMDPSRRTTPGRNGKVHLLSALARCGVCGGPIVVARSKPYKGQSKPIYRCRKGHVSRVLDAVDELVSEVVVKRLSRPDARAVLARPEAAGEALRASQEAEVLRGRLTAAAASMAAGVLTLEQLETITRSIREQLDQLEARAAEPDRARVLRPLLDDPRKAWETLSPQRRRAVVEMLMAVTLKQGREIEIVWR